MSQSHVINISMVKGERRNGETCNAVLLYMKYSKTCMLTIVAEVAILACKLRTELK